MMDLGSMGFFEKNDKDDRSSSIIKPRILKR